MLLLKFQPIYELATNINDRTMKVYFLFFFSPLFVPADFSFLASLSIAYFTKLDCASLSELKWCFFFVLTRLGIDIIVSELN